MNQILATPNQTGASRTDSTAQQIKNYILTNRLHPGDLLPTESVLCEALNVSRSSVRESIRRLAALDIVEVRHGHGTYVGQLSLKPLIEGLVFRGVLSPGHELTALREVVEVRCVLDMSMADNLARIMPTSDNSDLWAIVDEMEERSSRLETFLEVDRKFHKVLASRSDNLLIQQLVAALWEIHTVVYPQLLGLPLVQELDRIVKVHRAIVEACETGDSTKVKATMVEHYTPLREMLGMPPVAD